MHNSGSLAPGSDKMSKHTVAGGDGAGLLQLLARLRAKAERHGQGAVRVICIQEAGFELTYPLIFIQLDQRDTPRRPG
jgi:hypothetical protein